MIDVRRVARALVASVRTIAPAYPAALVLAAVPTLVNAAQGHHEFTGAVEAAAIVGGASLGFAVDDPAAVTLQSSPTTLLERRLARLLPSLAMVMALLGAVVLVTSMWSTEPIPLGFIAVEFCAAAGASLAVAAAATTDVAVAAGLGGALAALLVLGLVSSLATRYRGLPLISRKEFHDRWLWIAAVGAAMAVRGSLDAGRARRRQ